MDKIVNYIKWQKVLQLQCICLIGDHNGIWKHTKKRLDKLEQKLRQMPKVDEDYFYFNL